MKKLNLNYKFIISLILVFMTFLFFFGIKWAKKNFSFTVEELMFYLNMPMKGGSYFHLFMGFSKHAIFPSLVITGFLAFIIRMARKLNFSLNIKNKQIKLLPLGLKETTYLIVSIFAFFASLYTSLDTVGAFSYVNTQISTSTLIEENYVDPTSVDLVFPEEKRNLIYIYVESMEPTYLLTEVGGAQSDDLMPNMTKYSQTYTNFSNNSLIGGATTVPGVTWTVGGIVAQTSGLPLKLPIGGNNYGDFASFMPGAYTLGDILQKEGYNQMFMMGSDSGFGGRNSYLTSHGDYEIYDYFTALEKGKFGKDYFQWWGFEDEKLFEYAKEEILNIASKDEPFNFSLLTENMHFPDGYRSDSCEELFDQNLSNVVHCTDDMLKEFIEWIQEQDFYDNTTIVIAGDHVSMDGNYFVNIDEDYERTTYNLIINSVVTTDNTKNRLFSTMDLFPTTLASLGVEIAGNKLALGTNLFSEEKTLLELYEVEYVREELEKKSIFYNQNILLYDK